MSIIVYGLTGPALVTTGYGASSTSTGVILTQYIYDTDQTPPVVGTRAVRLFEANHDIKGFHFDRRRWVDEDDISTRNPGYIGNLDRHTRDQLQDSHWKSGISEGDDCDVVGLIRNAYGGKWLWSPSILHGAYYSFVDEYWLWSDESVTHPLISFFADEFDATAHSIPLAEQPKIGSPIHATIFRRESDFSALPYRHAVVESDFTGTLISAGSRNETVDSSGLPIYANVDTFLRCEGYHNPETNILYLNKNFAFKVCPISGAEVVLRGQDFAEEWMETAFGLGTPLQSVYVSYFPIAPPRGISAGYESSMYVMTWNANAATWAATIWSLADNNEPYFHGPSDLIYWVDYDLGIIHFGGYQAENALLAADLSASSTQILLDDASSYPPKGRVTLSSGEVVSYYGIDYNQPYGDYLVQCTRDSSVAVDLLKNAAVTHIKQGSAVSNSLTIGVAYETTPRIEYEPQYSDPHMVADDVDVRPVMNETGNGIIYISRHPLQIDRVVLETDKPLIGYELYGPLYAGTDYALLTATAYSALDEPVPGVVLTIDETNMPFVGLLNGAPNAYSRKTSSKGQVKASYTTGGNLDMLGQISSGITIGATSTTITVDGDYSTADADDVFLFGITKDDPFLGTVGLFCDYVSWANSSTYTGALAHVVVDEISGYDVLVSDVYPDGHFDGGTIYVVMADGVTYERTIFKFIDSTFHLAENLPNIPGAITQIRVMASDWVAWRSDDHNGKKKIVYGWDPTAIHPVTGAAGAYFPINPSSISYASGQTSFVFDYVLPTFDASDDTNNLGAYWLTLPHVVTFRAYGRDQLTGQLIYSNNVSLQIEIPDYLQGVEDSVAGRIPYGFRFKTSTPGMTATGFGGSTFLSINTQAGLTNPWASMVHLADL
jgi:hypothetical protein